MDLSLESLRMKVAILPFITEPTFGSKFEKFSNCRVLLIGDTTHGPSEFYTASTKITHHLIHHHGFNIAAIQADWPDAEAIDCYVRRRLKQKPSTEADLDTTGAELDTAFQQFPT
jgi:erythromycin esterase-like protein